MRFRFYEDVFLICIMSLKIRNTKTFIEEVKSGKIIEDFCYTFPIQENEMFRDPSFWRTLRVKIIPKLKYNNKLSFWFPELTSTEDLVSLLVILKELDLVDDAKIYCNVCSVNKTKEIKEGKISGKNQELNRSNFKRLELDSKFENYFYESEGDIYLKDDLIKKC